MKASEISKKIKSESERLGLHFNQVIAMVAYERAIPRLISMKELQENIIFKGGMVMRVVYGSNRFTVDLDLSFEKLSQEILIESVEKAMSIDLDDGFSFESGKWSKITEHKDYSGLRYSTDFYFNKSKIQLMQLDFTLSEVSDSFVKKNIKLTFDNDKIACNVYSTEQILAEKLHALVERGDESTRSKDLFDINFLLKQKVNHNRLKKRLEVVFNARKTNLPQNFSIFFKGIDKTRLENSWGRVEKHLPIHKPFEDVLKEFESNMLVLDSMFTFGLGR